MHVGPSVSEAQFTRRVLIVAAVAAAAIAVWLLSPLFLLVFASILVAITLAALAQPLRGMGLGKTASIVATTLLIIGALGSAAVFYGGAFAEQIGSLNGRFSTGVAHWVERLHLGDLGQYFNGSEIAASLSKFLSFGLTFGQAMLAAVLVLVGGVYFAIDPDDYRDGFVKLLPNRDRPQAKATFADIDEALSRWLRGMLAVMLMVGVLTGLGLWLVGVPSPLALGALAAVANFVPYVGPVFTALVVFVVAAAENWHTLLLAAGVMLAVQQLEGNVISPVIVGGVVNIMPATGLFAIVAMGMLFGPLGVLLGYPLTIVADIALRRLWVRDTLDEPVEILGKPAKSSLVAGKDH